MCSICRPYGPLSESSRGAVPNPHPVEPGTRQGQLERFLDVGGRHSGGELPGQAVAGVVIEHLGQVIPAPALDLEVGEVGLPELIHPPGGLPALGARARGQTDRRR